MQRRAREKVVTHPVHLLQRVLVLHRSPDDCHQFHLHRGASEVQLMLAQLCGIGRVEGQNVDPKKNIDSE
jgi:hypothetical protein